MFSPKQQQSTDGGGFFMTETNNFSKYDRSP